MNDWDTVFLAIARTRVWNQFITLSFKLDRQLNRYMSHKSAGMFGRAKRLSCFVWLLCCHWLRVSYTVYYTHSQQSISSSWQIMWYFFTEEVYLSSVFGSPQNPPFPSVALGVSIFVCASAVSALTNVLRENVWSSWSSFPGSVIISFDLVFVDFLLFQFCELFSPLFFWWVKRQKEKREEK